MVEPVKIWNRALPNDFGTVSCLVKWNGQYAVLGVAHVLTPTCLGVNPATWPIVQCGEYDASDIGTIRNWDMAVSSAGLPQGFSRDAAVATIDDDTAANLVRQQNFLPSGIRAAALFPDEPLFFTGAASGMTHTTIIQDHDAQADFGYNVYELGMTVPARTVGVSLRGLIQTDRREEVIGGDSGSLLRDGGGKAIGILLGVDLVRSYCYFSPIDSILDEFDATLVTHDDPLARELGE